MDRRSFIKATGTALAAATVGVSTNATVRGAFPEIMRKTKNNSGLKLSFFPYELKLRHAFNLAKFSRTTTPDVQVELEYDGVKGYGEASMLPYLGESVESVTKLLGSLDLQQFKD